MNTRRFESRKRDHIRLALNPKNQATGQSGLDQVHLFHEALPEMDLGDVRLTSEFFGVTSPSPFFLSSMTAGHKDGEKMNTILARAAAHRGWPMGVGSQRRELSDPRAGREWKRLRKLAPKTLFFSNIGIAQAILHPAKDVLRLMESLDARALIVHLNALQEALQPEGTPQFRGGLRAIEVD
ncbi:MAG: alpha-hydroxy-acid oxidizing protein, partial [Bdellovibrionales bacterium]|nr:alpha-hydroxy-acid oxidizing protein [Bdellovibrionales bacterium]